MKKISTSETSLSDSTIDSLVDMRLEAILKIYDEKGGCDYGEEITQLEHGLQCAAVARERGGSASMIIANLLHDIGHLLHNQDEYIADKGIDMKHELLGEKYLARWFPEAVSRPIGLHVLAKRYLCTIDKEYKNGLSAASYQSFLLQGEELSEQELKAFVADPFFEEALLLREYDDYGKDPHGKPPSLDEFVPLIRRLLREKLEEL